jgi:DNA-directed RNA polymerase subunit RPC12/RpoP
MSEFKFLCPECGQKILGDSAYSGTKIACPTCLKTITIPSPASATPTPISTASAPPPPAPAPPAAASQTPGRLSGLAVASLICSVFVPLGWIPGILCGHRIKARMRRDIFLEGEKMANAGLLISYCVLMATLAMAGIFFLEHWRYSSVKVMRESPAAISAMQPRIVDEVTIGENEDDHDMDGEMLSMTSNREKRGRSAVRGGSFSYMMKVLPDQAMTLNCRYWGGERRGHEFDIAVDDQIIATQNLTDIAPGHFVDMEYKIPVSLTRGKTQVKVEFQAHPGMTAGGLYGCEMLKP